MGPAAAPPPVIHPHQGRAWGVYGEAVSAAREIYRILEPAEKKSASLFWPENIIRNMWFLLHEGNSDLVALSHRSVPDHFLFGHVANITVLSLRIGLAVGLEEDDAVTLGLAAFLSELGLAPHMELAAKTTKLTEDEYQLLRSHVEEGVKMMDLFPIPESPMKKTICEVIGQCHERVGGTGYPAGLKKEEIHPFAKIIGMVDTFEAMTHPRPWRAKTLPHVVLKSMVEENQQEFDPLLIRALVESLSFYPPGTFVRLNTGEVGRVVSTTPDLPLRPKVWMFMDAAGHRLPSPRTVTLAVQPTLFVADAIDETVLRTADARLGLELRAQCWWVKGL